MKVVEKKISDSEVLLEVTASPQDVAHAYEGAHVAFAQSMGLRPLPGLTIAQVAEKQLGIKNLDSIVEVNAIQALVPMALDKRNIVPAYTPKPSVDGSLRRGAEFRFRLDVDLKPKYELTSYDPIDLTIPPFKVDERSIDYQIQEMAKSTTTYVAIDPKPVEQGDNVLLAMECSENGKPMKNLTTEGRTYIAGSDLMPKSFDEQIMGMEPGQTKEFDFDAPGVDDNGNEITQIVHCKVTVKELQKEVVPEITDEWVRSIMPMYSTVDALRDAIRVDLSRGARYEYDNMVLQMAASELAKRFKGSIADEVYEAMRENLLDNLKTDLAQQGQSLEEFLQANGGEQQVSMMLMMQSRELLIQGYALDAVYRHEKMSIDDRDIENACRNVNPQMNPAQIRQQMESSGHGFLLREMAQRLKANRWVLDHANITVRKV